MEEGGESFASDPSFFIAFGMTGRLGTLFAMQ